jgi:two-component system response regulator NreC
MGEMTRKTRILIADNHGEMRASLRRLLESQPDMELAGEAADGVEALRAAVSSQPDIVLLGLNMPGPGLQQTIGELRRASPGSRIIVLTAHEDLANLHSALEAGASEYVPKSADAAELLAAIHAVRNGHTFMDSSTSPGVPAVAASPAIAESSLSARELEVLRLLAQGYSNLEIAEQIHLSVKTVETYRHRLRTKLGLRSRAELYRFAASHHLLAADTDRA